MIIEKYFLIIDFLAAAKPDPPPRLIPQFKALKLSKENSITGTIYFFTTIYVLHILLMEF